MRFLCLLSCFLMGYLFGQAPQAHLPAKLHLEEINAQWQHYPEVVPDQSVHFSNDVVRIRYHLELVTRHLRTQLPADITLDAQGIRSALLDSLVAYAEAERFPQNIYHSARRPYFIDHQGTHCAVGYLMKASGHGALAQAISQEQNYAYLADIRTEGVNEWAQTHGFTLAELAWIQPGYPPEVPITMVDGGADGPVNILTPNNYTGQLLIVGDFQHLGEQPCGGLGFYRNGQLTCISTMPEGRIEQIEGTGTLQGMVAVGEFTHGGQIYPLAIHDTSGWRYEAIPTRANAIGSAVLVSGSNCCIEMMITSPDRPSYQELWHLNHTTGWEHQLTVHGKVFDMDASMYGRVYAGHFDSVWVKRSNVADTFLLANNLIFGANYVEDWFTAGPEISDTVYTVTSFGNALYLGGTCSSASGRSEVCITRYLNGTLQPLVLSNLVSGMSSGSIQAMGFYDSDKLIFGGEFEITPFVGIYGNNLAHVNLVTNEMEALANLSGPVNSLAYFDGKVIFGGEFGPDNAGHLAQIDDPLTSLSSISLETLSIFPNPVEQWATVSGVPEGSPYTVLDYRGRVVMSGSLQHDRIDVSSLSTGMYLLDVLVDKRHARVKLLKVADH